MAISPSFILLTSLHGVHMKKHTLLPALILSILATLFIGLASVWAAEPEEAPARSNASSGIVTGLTGPSAVLTALEPASSRVLKLGDAITVGEEIRTNPGGQVEILWGRRALLTVPEQAQVRILEPLLGQILVQLSNGTVRAALSYSASRPMDVLTVQTPTTQVTTRGGIVEVTVSAPRRETSLIAMLGGTLTSPASERPPGGFVAVSTPVETIRILEGQARIEPLTPGANSRLLQAGRQVRLHGGAADTVSEFKPTEEKALSAVDQHRVTPKPVTQQIVGVHVEHALEVERLLQQAATVGDKKEMSGPDVKGAIIPTTIISTSLGVPAPVFPQASSTSGGISAPTGLSPGTTLNPSSGSNLSPSQGTGPSSSGTTSAINQSGGLNSNSLLQNIVKGKGKK